MATIFRHQHYSPCTASLHFNTREPVMECTYISTLLHARHTGVTGARTLHRYPLNDTRVNPNGA